MRRGFLRRCLAVVFSLLISGSGQLFNRQPRKALAILISAPLSIMLAAETRLLHTYRGLVAGLFMELFFLVWLIADSAAYGGYKAKQRPGFSKNRVLYLSAILLIGANAIGSGTSFYRDFLLGLSARLYPSSAMAPTMQAGDRFVVDMHAYEDSLPQRGDVILFRRHVAGSGTEEFVKRIIAIGGDTIEGKEGGVYVNGKRLNEPYARYLSSLPNYDAKRAFGPVTVGQGEYFVIGDNRDDSYDSRYFGAISLAAIEGRPLYLYWSRRPDRIGKTIR
jgi:signal peptidase I